MSAHARRHHNGTYIPGRKMQALEIAISQATSSRSKCQSCKEQIEKLREVVETPLLHPERFVNLGIEPPKVKY